MSTTLTPEQIKTDTAEYDEWFTIRCGSCGKESKVDDWWKDMPRGHNKCPKCGYTFIRKLGQDKYGASGIVLERILI